MKEKQVFKCSLSEKTAEIDRSIFDDLFKLQREGRLYDDPIQKAVEMLKEELVRQGLILDKNIPFTIDGKNPLKLNDREGRTEVEQIHDFIDSIFYDKGKAMEIGLPRDLLFIATNQGNLDLLQLYEEAGKNKFSGKQFEDFLKDFAFEKGLIHRKDVKLKLLTRRGEDLLSEDKLKGEDSVWRLFQKVILAKKISLHAIASKDDVWPDRSLTPAGGAGSAVEEPAAEEKSSDKIPSSSSDAVVKPDEMPRENIADQSEAASVEDDRAQESDLEDFFIKISNNDIKPASSDKLIISKNIYIGKL